jgi:hypothetical protein
VPVDKGAVHHQKLLMATLCYNGLRPLSRRERCGRATPADGEGVASRKVERGAVVVEALVDVGAVLQVVLEELDLPVARGCVEGHAHGAEPPQWLCRRGRSPSCGAARGATWPPMHSWVPAVLLTAEVA